MSAKNYPERKVCEIIFAHLSNSDEKIDINNNIDIYDLEDITLPLSVFKLHFYDNIYNCLKINEQFRHSLNFSIKNQFLKHSTYKNYHSNVRFNLVDILINKYIDNKKKKINDITKLHLTKETEKNKSILDFNVIESYLNFNDIIDIYTQNNLNKFKKFFRLKIIIHYHSSILDENITIGCNYLVKIPKKYRLNKNNTESDDEDEDESIDNETNDNESIYKSINQIHPLKNVAEKIDENNIVYSNYKNKLDKQNYNIIYNNSEINNKNKKIDENINIVYSNYKNKLDKHASSIIYDNSEINNEDIIQNILCDSDDESTSSYFSSSWWSEKKNA
jgi:hypothetical protein